MHQKHSNKFSSWHRYGHHSSFVFIIFCFIDDMVPINPLNSSVTLIVEAMLASIQELFHLSDEQLSELAADFESRLPEYLRNALHHGKAAA